MTEWYSYSELNFNRTQCTWIIENLGFFEDGRWPPQPSGYIDLPFDRKKSLNNAPFAKPIEIHAEITTRLEETSSDGERLMFEIENEYPFFTMSTAQMALNYISGYNRREISYREWQKEKSRPFWERLNY